MISGTLTPSTANLVPRPKNSLTVTDEQNNNNNNNSNNSNNNNNAEICEKIRTDASGRSAALERAYVHDVYENCEEPTGSVRPKVAQFLAGLDAGSMVCDVGCGNGRYLNDCNPLIYTLGIDRCYRLAKVTKSRGGEIAICDNLELPFRDETFDAVLSVAVVHHFATTERRVLAIRELARILRIGGRVIITVWALEQKQRRFESQDVLIPWQPPKNTNSNGSDDEDDDDFLPPYHAYTEDSTNSSRSAGDGDSSSLSSSSPGESCYSFVRRAIQKLAGSKRHPWFMESWNSKDTKTNSSLDYEDARDLPIELRHLEDFEDFLDPPLSAGLKSRSLGSILNPPPRQIVRSRSSVPSLGAQMPEKKSTPPTTESRRPKLVKQKQSLYDEHFVLPETNIPDIAANEKKLFLRKQSSLNEELMAENRIREKERVRKRIQKQTSLNEAFLCRSVFTKRLQVIREGLTTKLKTSTGSLERVTKNGIVKIMQNFKGNQTQSDSTVISPQKEQINVTTTAQNSTINMANSLACNGTEDEQKERRHSRESGSDSSKDSSLQSDTSIESEDSFASVIYIPRTEQQQLNNDQLTTTTIASSFRPPSVPTSPLIMPCPTPAHSPAPPRCKLQALLPEKSRFTFEEAQIQKSDDTLIAKIISTTKLSPKIEKVTKQVVRNLPQIPKFKKTASFPIVRRTSAAPSVPKLSSMEIFNPETDDLDSDSSEPSSPDSIDSVISALKPMSDEKLNSESSTTNSSLVVDDADKDDSSSNPDKTIENLVKPLNIILNSTDLDADCIKKMDEHNLLVNKNTDSFSNRQHLVEFAEQLSAQLLKELDNDDNSDNVFMNDSVDCKNDSSSNISDIINDKNTIFSLEDPYIKKLNGELRDLNSLREELRERRLMLANLNVHQYQTSSASSTIHEEDESPLNEDDQSSDENYSHNNISASEMEYLIEDDAEYENEDKLCELERCDVNSNRRRRFIDKEIVECHSPPDEHSCQDDFASIINSNDNLNVSISSQHSLNNSTDGAGGSNFSGNGGSDSGCVSRSVSQSGASKRRSQHRSSAAQSIESRQSIDSWAHSNSTASLDSPSIGGASTHHRYYHVFREGELDSLINHHVASLHIVSSYYERASWCVVAEKVQVWTI